MVLSLIAAALAVAPSAAVADDPPSLRAAYLELRDGGCEVERIGSPIVARALRNVPYAMNGKIFESPELTYLYEHDGGWYRPRRTDADVAAEDRGCVRALGAQEKKLRKRAAVKPGIEAALTRDPGTILEAYPLVQGDFRKFRQSDKTAAGTRTWRVEFEAGGGAALVMVECSLPAAEAKAARPDCSRLACHVLAAGCGDHHDQPRTRLAIVLGGPRS